MRPLKVGVQLPEVERTVRWPEIAEMARTAEAIGLDSIWVGDHLLYRYPDGTERGPWEAWAQLAALAAITTRVSLGPLVACTAFHAPALLAKQAATVDEISGGRLILGLGAGWNEAEFTAFGLPYDHRVGRFADAFAVVRRLLAGETVDHHGAYVRVAGARLLPPPRHGGPPLMVGSIGERMLEITLPHVAAHNAWYTWFGNRPAGIAVIRAQVDAACRRVGRDPAEVERSAAVLVAFGDAAGRPSVDAFDAEPRSGDDPVALAADLHAFAAEGIGHVQLVLDPITVASLTALVPTLAVLDRA